MKRKTGPPEEWPCKVCGKTTLPFDRHSFSAHLDSETDEWKAIAYCSEECKGEELVQCKECKKFIAWRHAYHTEEGSASPRTGWFHWKNAWCSRSCYVKKEKRDKRREAIAEIFFWAYLLVPPIAALTGLAFGIYLYYPDLLAAFARIIPVSGIIFLLSLLDANWATRRMNGMSGPIMMWFFSFGIPFGGVCVVSTIVFIAINVYTGMSVWLKL